MAITTQLIIQCILMFILGQLLQLFWLKIPSLKKRAKAANYQFSIKEYWGTDWNLILGTQVIGAMLILGLNELTQWKPIILEVVRWFFGGIGAFSNSVVLSKLSSYEKKLNNFIDVKTDIADGVEPKRE